MQQNILFTPGGPNDPLTVTNTDGTNILAVWLPSPTNLVSISIPSVPATTYQTVYKLGVLSAETVPLGPPLGAPSVRIQSDGTGGAPFWVITSDQEFPPFKEAPQLTIPSIIDLSSIGVYNYQRYGATQGATPTVNTNALVNMIANMSVLQSYGAGWAWIPPGNYQVTALNTTLPDQSVWQGMGTIANTGSGSCMFSITTAGTFFNIAGPHSDGGINLKNLAFGFTSAAQNLSNVAVIANTENVRIEDCSFADCATAVRLVALSCSLRGGTIVYNGINGGSGPTGCSPQVVMAAPETSCIGNGNNEMRQVAPSSAGGPSGIAAISLHGPSCEHPVISGWHLSYFDYGITCILAGGGPYQARISDCEIQAVYSALYLVPGSSTGTIFDFRATDCSFIQVNNPPASLPTVSGVFIDTNGGPNANVDDIEFKGCRITEWYNLYGMQINGGRNIRVIGGVIANNGIAGVGITGAAGNITLIGVNMQPSYANAQQVQNQTYAIQFGSSAGFLATCTVIGCNWTGYSGNPVSVLTGGMTNSGRLYVHTTTGYNDTASNWSGLPSACPTASTTAAANGYYGMTTVDLTASGSTVVSVNGVSETLLASQTWSRTLSPYDTFFKVSGSAPTLFSWKGIWA